MAASLTDMATRACIQNVDGFENVGDYPYRIVQPILRKVKTAAQLQAIEKESPHIVQEDAELWKAFIMRDIPNGEQRLPAVTPSDPTKWSRVYRKLKKEDELQQDAAEAALKAALNKKSNEKRGKTTQFVHAVIAEKKKPVWGAPRAAPSGSQALKNARTTTDRLTILKCQTANRQAGRTATQSIPAHELIQRRGVVQQAPRSMVNQYNRTTANPSAQIQARLQQRGTSPPVREKIFNSESGLVSDRNRAINAALRQEREDKERRLRALTGATKAVVNPSQGDSAQPARSGTSTKPAVGQPQRAPPQPMRSAAPTTTRMVPPPSKATTTTPNRATPQPAKAAATVAAPGRTTPPSSSPAKTAAPQPSTSATAQTGQKRKYKYDPFFPARKRKT